MQAVKGREGLRERPTASGSSKPPTPLPTAAGRTKRRGQTKVGPCTCMAVIVVFMMCVLFGPRGLRYMRSYLTRNYVEGWETDPTVTAATQELEAAGGGPGRCQLPRYPDTAQVSPAREDFVKRFWTHSRMASVMIEVGSILWSHRELTASRESLQGVVTRQGQWTLHFAHSNKTVMEHHVHLERVFRPDDPLNAPWAEVDVDPAPWDMPKHFFPVRTDGPWKALIVPALSGRSPTTSSETLYLVVLSGKVRIIIYRASHAFHIPDDHVYDWHSEALEKVRSSGNHGKTCILHTDEALLLPSGYGYTFLAIENTVMLQVEVQEGF